jgi:N-acylneuraminate cytidylyltransferase
MKERCLSVITARGGSKRIPRKNIKEFCGKPIIAYSIQAAIDSNVFDVVMVSTDDSEIAAVAKNIGAVVPFYRSAQTSNDFSSIADVLFEVIENYSALGEQFDIICCMLPTAPLLRIEDLSRGLETLQNQHADVVIPVVRYSYPIQRALQVINGKLHMIHQEFTFTRSNDLEPTYHDAGQFYWLRAAPFLKNRTLFCENTVHIELPEILVQDIDTEDDWKLAEIKYGRLKRNNESQ